MTSPNTTCTDEPRFRRITHGVSAVARAMNIDAARLLACDAFMQRLLARANVLDRAELARPAVVFAPHPDDEVLGCGGTIVKKRRAGAEVTIVFMTDGGRSHPGQIATDALVATRRREAIAAAQVLGVPEDHVVFLDFPDGALGAHHASAVMRITEILTERAPLQILSPCSFDWHRDHVATSRIVSSATRSLGGGRQHLGYSVYMWKWWPWSRDGAAQGVGRNTGRATLRGAAEAVVYDARVYRFLRRVTHVDDVLDTKRAALAEHRSQMVRRENEPGWGTLEDWSRGDFLRSTFCGFELFAELDG